MKKIITTCLILLSIASIAQDLKNKVTIYQDGKEFEVKSDTIPIVLKNKKFSIRFYIEKKNRSTITFFTDRDAFLQIENKKDSKKFDSALRTVSCYDLGYPDEFFDSYYMNSSLTSFLANYSLYHYMSDLPSDNKNLLRKELVITNLEGVDMKDFF